MHLDDDASQVRPIQQFRFGDSTERQYVFYWYYILPTRGMEQLSDLQKQFRQMRHEQASVTLEVFARQKGPDDDGSAAFDFVQQLDRSVRAQLVPEDAVRGSDRQSIIVQPGFSDPTH
jgi:hypothetical protein